MVKSFKNDIFEILKQIDNKNYGYYNSLSEDQKKEFQPYTVLRWMMTSSGNEENHKDLTIKVNNIVNNHFWELSKYKDLQYKLLCVCGTKRYSRHQWLPISKRKNNKDYNIIREFYKNLNEQDFLIIYNSLSKEDIDNILKFMGEKDR